MAIQVNCDSCFFTFSVKEEHAGKRGKCPECGSLVQIPARSGGSPARSPRPGVPAAARRPAPAAESAGGSSAGLLIGAGVGGVLLILAVVGFLAFRMGRGNAPPGAPAPVASNDTGTTPASNSTGTAPPAPAGAAPVTTNRVDSTGNAANPAGTAIPTSTTTSTSPSAIPSADPSVSPTSTGGAAKTFANTADLIEAVEPCAVRINAAKSRGVSTGSGFVVDKEGTVVTNYHVIEEASAVSVEFANKSKANVLGYLRLEPKLDLAILKIDFPADQLVPAKLADKPPRKGEELLAIGAPLGLDFTTTDGKVSGLRDAAALKEFGADVEGTWIQTDTPISPGNSGGPLFNMQGEIVGANTMSIRDAQNLNFATSAANIRQALSQKSSQPIAITPQAAPVVATRRRDPEEGIPVVDESKTDAGRKLLSQVKEVLLREINVSYDQTGKVTDYVRQMAANTWKQVDVDVTNNRSAPAFMLVRMEFKKNAGTASASILEIHAYLFVADLKGTNPRIAKVWEGQDEVGTLSKASLTKGDIPQPVRRKVLDFFGKLKTARKDAEEEFRNAKKN